MKERAYWIAWLQISGIGFVLLSRLQQHFGSLAEAWRANDQDLAQVEGIGVQKATKIVTERLKINPIEFQEEHLIKNPSFWIPHDPDYPRLLLEIPNPPPILYYRGKVDLNENYGKTSLIAMVGTRDASEYGKKWTRKISTALAKAGITVVSGLASGIDTEAHLGALNGGGRTLAIFGTGVDIVYPKENESLAERVLNQGLIISEYPSGTKPFKTHFPRRNRIIAGLSRAILVMEAGHKSGALITALQAKDFQRPIYTLTARLDDEKSLGCLELLSQGAQSIPPHTHQFLSEERLLEMLGVSPSISREISSPNPPQQLSLFAPPPEETPINLSPPLEPKLAQVFTLIGSEPMLFDTLVIKSHFPTGELSAILLELELLGLISQLPGMRYQRI